ncbi:MAG: hypothetical protein LZF61_08775 [Nitrosomonas sp.]|nr:MAG: hypothetical protein LZF61_08775 [Nitrosomonas sp.]
MTQTDNCCSIAPYFRVQIGQIDAFKALCQRFVAQTQNEPLCLYYGFCFDGDTVYCREGYQGAEGVLAHLANVGSLLQEALKIAELTRLEIHGPAAELAKLRTPLADYQPQFLVLEHGFRK